MFPVRDFSKLTDSDFIGLCYQVFLNRIGDPGGTTSKVANLKAGSTKSKEVLEFITSLEYRRINEDHSRDLQSLASFFLDDEFVQDAIGALEIAAPALKLTTEGWMSLVETAFRGRRSFFELIEAVGLDQTPFLHGFISQWSATEILGKLLRSSLTENSVFRLFVNDRLFREYRLAELVRWADLSNANDEIMGFKIQIPDDLWRGAGSDLAFLRLEKDGKYDVAPSPAYLVSPTARSMSKALDKADLIGASLFQNAAFF
jgi:Domain of unknown function (DUF4214)